MRVRKTGRKRRGSSGLEKKKEIKSKLETRDFFFVSQIMSKKKKRN